ncbi:ABC transporter substrate-binding protein [Limnobacter sp.]|uniref:ABC transporter substrate-binding protein n=1 Tax=Limnobacter sp. TaxID=2003368 RepID=UPI003517E8B2
MKLKPITQGLFAAFAMTCGGLASAQYSGDTIKIGMITDMSGLYADIDGPGGVEAVKMAIADFGGTLNGKKIEFVFADHQNKADIAASKAREWFDVDGVDMLISGTNSGTALAMAKVADEKKKPNFVIGAGTARITNEECNPYSIHYAYDTVAMAKGTGSAVVKQGGKNWYFLTADYAFGTSLETDTSTVVKANGGTVKGSIRHPLSASDFSSFMLQAQASGAQILGLANAGGDTVNSIKAANEFGVTSTMKLAGLLMFINDVHALGLNQTKGMYLTDSWYWDQNDESRKWSQRFFDKMKKMPSSLQAADYSATLQYLNAVKAAGTDDGPKVMEALRKQKVNDMYAKNGYYRADGSMIHDMFLMQVKDPKESKKPWDYLKVVQAIPGEQAFTTKAETKCALWK